MGNTIKIQTLMDRTGVKFGTSGIRGLVSEMTNEVVTSFVIAFVDALEIKPGSKVGVATDLRPSSPDIAKACCSALLHRGIAPVYFGSIPTPALAYYSGINKMPAIMVTGSHIPFDRNGIKFYSEDGEITKQHERDIAARVLQYEQVSSASLPRVCDLAKTAYINRYLDFFPKNVLSGKKIGFYEHSSVARNVLTSILRELGAEVFSLEPSENFVPIDTEAVPHKIVQKGREWSKKYNLDAIISTDGDADRPLVADENGNWLRGDILGLLTSKYLGINDISTPVSCNTCIESSGYFTNVVRTKIGSPYVIEGIQKLLQGGSKSVAGFEANGGYILASKVENSSILNPLLTRDAVLPILSILADSSETASTLSSLLLQLPERFTSSDRLKDFPNEKSNDLIEYLLTDYQNINNFFSSTGFNCLSFDCTDGLRMTMGSGDIIHIRQSGNAPELRCYVESSNFARAEEIVNLTLNLIKEVQLD